MASPRESSHFQEDALAVEGVEENPADANITRRLKEGLQVLGQEGKETAEDLRGGIGEIGIGEHGNEYMVGGVGMDES